jgi:hypothetical protein
MVTCREKRSNFQKVFPSYNQATGHLLPSGVPSIVRIQIVYSPSYNQVGVVNFPATA